MKLIHLSYLLLLLTGCSSTHQIGHINGDKYHVIRGRALDGPNFAVLTVTHPNGTTEYVTSVGGPGIGAALVGAGGNVGAALGLRPAQTSITMTGSGNGGNGGNGTSASSSRSVSDSVIENSGNSNSTSTGGSSTASGGFVPPGHQDNPSTQNGHRH